MKKALRPFNFLFLSSALLLAATAFAGQEPDPKVEKKKSYTKTYAVSSGDRIKLNNQFGEMKLITWEKNEVKVDVAIIAKADDEARAQEILDKITIEDGKNSDGVHFKTEFANDKKDWDKDKEKNKDGKKTYRNEGMEINYTVYLPAGNELHADNQFGAMIVPDYRGEATLISKFGSLKSGKISNAKNVSVEFGKADLGHINGGKLSIKFSKGTVSKLSGDVDANFEFCDKIKVNVDNDVKELDIKNSYSHLYLDLNKNFSGNYVISTSHGNFDNKSTFAIKEEGKDDDDRYGPRFTRKYSGTSGSGNAKVKINSSFGEVVIGHDLQVDMTETKKKPKTRAI